MHITRVSVESPIAKYVVDTPPKSCRILRCSPSAASLPVLVPALFLVQVNSLEMEMLRMISFSLFVQADQYERYRSSLYSHATSSLHYGPPGALIGGVNHPQEEQFAAGSAQCGGYSPSVQPQLVQPPQPSQQQHPRPPPPQQQQPQQQQQQPQQQQPQQQQLHEHEFATQVAISISGCASGSTLSAGALPVHELCSNFQRQPQEQLAGNVVYKANSCAGRAAPIGIPQSSVHDRVHDPMMD